MSKLIVFLMMSVFFTNVAFARIIYDVKHTLPKTDEFYQAESEILAKGKISATEATNVLLQLMDEKSLTDKKVYVALRTSYQYLIGHFLSPSGQMTKAQADEINAFNNVLRKAVDMVLPQFANCPQILELLGDFNYFGLLSNSGSNVALMLHYKAYSLGHKTDSLKLKIMLDLVRMYRGREIHNQIEPGTIINNRDGYLFPLSKENVDVRDSEKWLQLSMHFYNLAEEKDTITSIFFKHWFEGHKDFKVDQTLLKEAFADLNEQMANYEIELKEIAKRYQSKIENQKKAEAIREANQKNMEERKKRFEATLTELDVFEKLPNPIEKAESIFKKLSDFRKELKEYQELPNYKKLKSLFPEDSEEADVLNLFFLYMIKNYEKALTVIETLKTKDKDTRIYYLKFICLIKSKAPDSLAEECLDAWFKLDPNDPYAKRMKGILDSIKANSDN